MNRNFDSARERGNDRLGRFELRCRARYVEFRSQPRLRPGPGEFERVLLRLDVLVRNLQPSLEPAQLRIRAAYISAENHEYVATILVGGCNIRAGRLDAAPYSSENIQLPGRR